MLKQEAVTAADHIYRNLRDRIAYGDIQPGTRLARRPLAAAYGTSSMPVLEAIRRLERDGLVVSHPSWGTVVRTWSIGDIESVYVIRESVEAHAARLFTQNATVVQRVQLEEYNKLFDNYASQRLRRECSESDINLHMYIVECTGLWFLNHIASTCGIISTSMRSATRRPIAQGEDFGSVGIHKELLATLNSGDPDLAESVARVHVRNGRDRILAWLREE
jgi:DNA-binding GntR family transcriptional regulator